MLIRSQDKKELHTLNTIVIVPKYKLCDLKGERIIVGYQTVIFISSEENAIIGEYSTEEKAIKVLDMIEKFYENIEYTKFMGCGREEIASYIFRMPQDSEV